jgi:hypothetical protein
MAKSGVTYLSAAWRARDGTGAGTSSVVLRGGGALGGFGGCALGLGIAGKGTRNQGRGLRNHGPLTWGKKHETANGQAMKSWIAHVILRKLTLSAAFCAPLGPRGYAAVSALTFNVLIGGGEGSAGVT